jgi:hypothetical protein
MYSSGGNLNFIATALSVYIALSLSLSFLTITRLSDFIQRVYLIILVIKEKSNRIIRSNNNNSPSITQPLLIQSFQLALFNSRLGIEIISTYLFYIVLFLFIVVAAAAEIKQHSN